MYHSGEPRAGHSTPSVASLVLSRGEGSPPLACWQYFMYQKAAGHRFDGFLVLQRSSRSIKTEIAIILGRHAVSLLGDSIFKHRHEVQWMMQCQYD